MLQRQHSTQADRVAADMTEGELFRFIDGNEGLRTWMLDQPEELAQRIVENPRLQRFFAALDIPQTAKKYRTYREGGTQ